MVKKRVISHKRAAGRRGAKTGEQSDKSQRQEGHNPEPQEYSRWISLAEKALAADQSSDKKSE